MHRLALKDRKRANSLPSAYVDYGTTTLQVQQNKPASVGQTAGILLHQIASKRNDNKIHTRINQCIPIYTQKPQTIYGNLSH